MATLSAVRCNPALRAYYQTLAPPPERPALKKLGPTHADQPSERFRSRVAVRRRDLAGRTSTVAAPWPTMLSSFRVALVH